MVWGVGVTTLDEVGSTEKLGETQIWPLGHCRYFWILALLHAPCRQQQNMQCQKSSFCLGGQSENVICWGGSSSQKVAVTLSKFIPQDGLSNPNGDGSWVQSLWFWHVSGGLKYNQCGVSKMADLFFKYHFEVVVLLYSHCILLLADVWCSTMGSERLETHRRSTLCFLSCLTPMFYNAKLPSCFFHVKPQYVSTNKYAK